MGRQGTIFGVAGIIVIIVVAFLGWSTMKEERSPSESALPTTGKTYTVGLLNYNSILTPTLETFKKSLERLAEQDHVTVYYREISSSARPESLRRAVDILSNEQLDLIVTGQGAVLFIREKIPQVPVISALTANVQSAQLTMRQPDNQTVFIDSGANMIIGERLSHAIKLVPEWKTILVLRGPDEGPFANSEAMNNLHIAAKKENVTLIEKQFTDRKELNEFFLDYDMSAIDAIFRYPDSFITANLDILFAMSRQAHVQKPLIVRNRTELEMGGLVAYGTNIENFGHRAAYIAYDILTKKLSLSDMSMEEAYHFELGINKSVATMFGLEIPASFLKEVDYIVE